MTIRCGECRATLRVRPEAVNERSHADCPSCGAEVALGNRGKIEVHCGSCRTRLLAPASSVGVRARCPKCRAAVTIMAQERASAGSPRSGVALREAGVDPAEDPGVSTQRIPMRSLGLADATAGAGQPFMARADAPATTRRGHAGGDSAAAALLDPPVESLTQAAEGIRDAASSFPDSAEPEHEPAPPAVHASLESSVTDRPLHPDAAPAARVIPPLPAALGVVTGALAGGIIGFLWSIVRAFAGTLAVEPFIAPAPTWMEGLALPEVAITILLPAVLGSFVGLAAAVSEPGIGSTAGRRFVRCAVFGMIVGAAFGAAWFLSVNYPMTMAGLSPAFNWVRDMMAAGMIASLLSLFFLSGDRESI